LKVLGIIKPMAGSSGLSLNQGFEDYPWKFHFSFQMYIIIDIIIVYYIQMSNRLF